MSTFLRSSRHFNSDTVFGVTASFLNENVHGFDIICNGRVETRFQIVKFRRFPKFVMKKHELFSCTMVHCLVKISKIATSHRLFRFSCSGKNLVRDLSAVAGNSWADALETNCFVNVSIVIWLWSTLLDKFTTDEFILFILFCVCWNFSGRYFNIFENFRINCGSQPFLKGKSYLEMRILSPI